MPREKQVIRKFSYICRPRPNHPQSRHTRIAAPFTGTLNKGFILENTGQDERLRSRG